MSLKTKKKKIFLIVPHCHHAFFLFLLLFPAMFLSSSSLCFWVFPLSLSYKVSPPPSFFFHLPSFSRFVHLSLSGDVHQNNSIFFVLVLNSLLLLPMSMSHVNVRCYISLICKLVGAGLMCMCNDDMYKRRDQSNSNNKGTTSTRKKKGERTWPCKHSNFHVPSQIYKDMRI